VSQYVGSKNLILIKYRIAATIMLLSLLAGESYRLSRLAARSAPRLLTVLRTHVRRFARAKHRLARVRASAAFPKRNLCCATI
jgi:hypothetical protein